MFDGEVKKDEEAEAWILGLTHYLWVHNYFENMKGRVSTFNLIGGSSIWWEYLKNVKGINEENMTWKQFEKYFRKAYLL